MKSRLYEHEIQKREEENQKELQLKQILDGVIKLDHMYCNPTN